MNKKAWSLAGIVAILAVGIGVATVNHQQSANNNAKKETIVIGSKNFTESKVLMQIYADALKKKGYSVKLKANISSSVIYQAIKSKQIDLYPEYTGTIATSYLKKNAAGKSASAIAKIAKDGMAKENLATLSYAPGSDSQGLAIASSAAKKYNIYTISDLQKKANKVRFVSQGEFDKRADALPGLEKAYGKFNFKSHKVYDDSLKYRVLEKGDGDVTPAYTTEGQLASSKFTILKDNKHFWPPYNVVPLVRKSVLKKNPEIATVLNAVDKKLTTKALSKLNYQVDMQGRSYQKVASEWIAKNYR
ncbi:MAG: glycine betaine ABC transporter substrate-binding protein [Lactobacillus equicursoris]|uniref:glycine betaine ABC transporter substrate-binding protein n=1 Tax=Lactobacillus equicursoris TaxID=420645 RepID=UPI00242CD53A|nr:glycine betaine ABC transporter substrate-binding protein [Lactobacillus equicursoris]MDD6407071.1 glycine betaine ABC transporter substrate-binding protein [Lactobacillus equicursoris]